MTRRLDVRRMLLARGWTEDQYGICRKNGALWAPANDAGDSGLDGGDGAYSIPLTAEVPARIITAMAELIAADKPRPAKES